MQHRTWRNVLSVILAVTLVFTCNDASFQPLTALADTVSDASAQSAVGGSADDSADAGSGQGSGLGLVTGDGDTSGLEDAGEGGEAPLGDGGGSTLNTLNVLESIGTVEGETPSNADATGEDDADDDADQAAAHKAVRGDLPVTVTFTLDDDEDAAHDVTLQLQSRTQTYDSDAQTWGAWTEWTDSVREDATQELTAQQVKDAAEAGEDATYTWRELPLQQVSDAGALEQRTQYRAVAVKVADAELEVTATDEAAHTMTLAGATQATENMPAIEYAQVVSTEPSLYVVEESAAEGEGASETSEADATAAVATETAKLDRHDITLAGVTVPAEAAAEPAVQTEGSVWTVYTKTYNIDQNLSFNLSEAVFVSVYKKDGTLVRSFTATPGNNFDISSGGYFTIDCSDSGNAPSSVNVYLADPSSWDTGFSIMPSSSVTLNSSNPTTTFVIQTPYDDTLPKDWNDNNNDNGKRPDADAFSKALSLEFSTDGGKTWSSVADNLSELGYAEAPVIPVADTSSYGTWNYAFTNLHHLNNKGEEVTYRLAEDASKCPALSKYISSYTTDTDGTPILVNTEKSQYKATKEWKDENNTYKTRLDIDKWMTSGSVRLYRTTSGTDPKELNNITDPTAEGYVKVATDADPSKWTITLPNAPAFDELGNPYTYYLTENGGKPIPVSTSATASYLGSHYTPTYENVDNFASNTVALYSGGTLTNTLEDTYEFKGEKQWADDGTNKEARPSCEWVLYRYPADGEHDYKTASPVAIDSIKSDEESLDTQLITFPSAKGVTLPRYDMDGCEYVYFVKELMTYGEGDETYKAVFDNKKEGIEDDAAGMFLFDGGTLTNKLTGSVDVECTKTWNAAARADVKAEVTINLMRYEIVYDEKTGEPTKDTDGNYIYNTEGTVAATQILSDFSAEFTSQTALFENQEKYDSHGLPYKYETVEAGVKTMADGSMQSVALSTGTNDFVTADGYRYRQATTTDENGKVTITNTLVGDAVVNVTKKFPDGMLNTSETITYTIYQDGVAIGTYKQTYEGKADNTAQSFSTAVTAWDTDGFTPAEGNPTSGNLPRYAPDGHEYKYSIAEDEVKPGGYTSKFVTFSQSDALTSSDKPASATNEHYLNAQMNISNYKNEGGRSILVKKEWLDDNDMADRMEVEVALVGTDGNVLKSTDGTEATGTILKSEDRTWIAVPTCAEGAAGDANSDGYLDVAGVIEVSVGGNEVTQNAAITNKEDFAANHLGWDKSHAYVETAQHEYDVSVTKDSNSEYTVTNRRIGSLSIDITKTWVDGSDTGNTRPKEISFNVKSDNEEGLSGTITLTGAESTFTPDDTNQIGYTETVKDKNTWQATTVQLPKYDSSGKVIHYEVAEQPLNGEYVSTLTASTYKVGDKHTLDVASYQYENKLSASVTPSINKYWKDGTTGVTRPDIVLSLYESYKTADGKTVTKLVDGYVDRDWRTTTMDKGDGHWWRCDFEALPKYTNEGYQINYFVSESVKVPGEFTAQNYYKNAPSSENGSFVEDDSNKVTDNLELTDEAGTSTKTTVTAAPVGGTIVNRLEAKRTVSGVKIWENLPSGLGTKWYPDVTFALYVDDGTGKPDTTQEKAIAVAAHGATSFKFSEVDKYDAEGEIIKYLVREKSPDDLSLYYTIEQFEELGARVQNTYKTDQNYSITFTKTWGSVPTNLEGKQCPSVEVQLVRYMKETETSEPVASTREIVKGTDGLVNPQTITYSNTDKGEVKWDHLPYYAPNGVPYVYKVEELTTLHGYTTKPGNAVADVTVDKAYAADADGNYSGSGKAELTNTYTGEPISLTVSKTWDDKTSYGLSTRPTSIKVQLYRTTDSGIFSEQAVTKEITLTGDATASTWSQKLADTDLVENLKPGYVKYAPNGEAYKYYLKEVPVPDGYNYFNEKVTPADVTGNSFTISGTNTLQTTSLSASKVWNKQVGEDTTSLTTEESLFAYDLNALPKSITYTVQYSTDGGVNWSNLLSGTNALQMTSSYSDGTYTTEKVAKLPTVAIVDSKAKSVQYRALESQLTYRESKSGAGDKPVDVKVEPVTTGDSASGWTSTVTNTLPMKELTIKKTWDDAFNSDGKRPSQLSFAVTRTGVNSDSDTETATVVLNSSNAGSSTPTGEAANTWTKTIKVPVRNNPDTADSLYTIQEGAKEGSDGNPENTTELTDYTPQGDKSVNLGSTQTSASFTNKRTPETFTATASKMWMKPVLSGESFKDLNGKSYYNGKSLAFQLQYAVGTSNTWLPLNEGESAPKKASGGGFTSDETTQTVNLYESGVLKDTPMWAGLPKYVDNKNVGDCVEYRYKVVETSSLESFDVQNPNSIAGGSVTESTVDSQVTNTLKTTTLSVTKTWDDSSNLYGTRPKGVEFKVQYSTDNATWSDISTDDGCEWKDKATFVMDSSGSNGDTWSASVSGLPEKDAEGKAYYYRAVETALIYANGTADKKIEVTNGDSTIYKAESDGAVAAGDTLENAVETLGAISVTKIWDDKENQDGKRPDKVDVTLQRCAESSGNDVWKDVQTVSLEASTWTYRWSNVPKYLVVDGAVVAQKYRVIEKGSNDLKEYTVAYSSDGENFSSESIPPVTTASDLYIKNSYTPKTMSVGASKKWDDQSNFFGIRPSSLTFTLEYSLDNDTWVQLGKAWTDGTTTYTVEGTADKVVELVNGELLNDPKWENLPVNVNPTGSETAAGKTINVQYRVVETAVGGYTTTYDNLSVSGSVNETSDTGENKASIEVKNTMETQTLTGTKEWVDGSDKYGTRPALDTFKSSLKLFVSNGTTEEEVSGKGEEWSWSNTGTNSWTYEISGLPSLPTGWSYVVKETVPSGYTVDPTDEKVSTESGVVLPTTISKSLTNTLQTTSLSVEKTWSDYEDDYGLRPDSITFKVERKLATAGDDAWSVLQKNENGEPIDETIVLDTSSATSDTSIWKKTLADLPKVYTEGNEYDYRAVEVSAVVNGETIKVADGKLGAYSVGDAITNGDAESGFNTAITNTLDVGYLEVTKEWDDASNQDGKRPEVLTLTLSATVNDVPVTLPSGITTKKLDPAEDGSWADASVQWDNLPIRDAAGNIITYSVTEEAASGDTLSARDYDATYKVNEVDSDSAKVILTAANTKDNPATIAFTNKHTPETVTKTVVKRWEDNNDEFKLRPNSLKVTLWRMYTPPSGDEVKESVKDDHGQEMTIELNSSNDWTGSFENLPAYLPGSQGVAVTYFYKEASVAGYYLTHEGDNEVNVSQYDMTNKLKTTGITAEKVWSDSGNTGETRSETTFTLEQTTTPEDETSWKQFKTKSLTTSHNTDASEEVEFSDLPVVGKDKKPYYYRIVESTLDNYVTTIDVGSLKAVEGANGEPTDSGTITVTNTANSFTLVKKNADGSDALAGATFELEGMFFNTTTKRAEKTTKTLLSGTSSSETLSGLLLAGQEYTVNEVTPPKGYASIPDFKVTMGVDGNLTCDNSPSGVTVSGSTVTINDPQNSISIVKKGKGVSLDGTTFELTPATESDSFATSASPIKWTVSDSDPTNNPYVITGELVADTVYKLSETTPAPGYTVAADVYLKVDAAGALYSSSSTDGIFAPVTDNELTVDNSLNHFSLAKQTTGSTNLAGASFELQDGSGVVQTWTSISDEPTEGKGLFTGVLTAEKEYTIVETSPAPGYVASSWKATYDDAAGDGSALTVKMDNAGRLYYKTNAATDKPWAEVTDNKLVMKDAQTAVEIVKTDKDGRPIGGAEFTLTGRFVSDGAGVSSALTWTSNNGDPTEDKGLFTGKLIVGEEYTLAETVPPEGYTLATNPPTKIRVLASGTVEYTVNGTDWRPVGDKGIRVSVANPQNNLTIKKVDATKDANPLTGAVFEVTGIFANATTEATLTLEFGDKSEASLIGKLVAGKTYKVHEKTSPGGYAKVADFEVSIDDKGTLSLAGNPTGVKLENNVLIVADPIDKITIVKVNQFGDPVPGATLQLEGEFANGTTSPITWTTDESSNAKTLEGELIVGKEYTLSEITPPDGYIKMSDTVLRITDAGVLQERTSGEGDSAVWRDVDNNTFKAVNNLSLANVTLQKLTSDEPGAPLDGSTFSLYKKGAGTNGADLLITDKVTPTGSLATWSNTDVKDDVTNPDTGYGLNKGLANGTYYFVETAAPVTHALDATTHIEFTVDNGSHGETKKLTAKNDPMNAKVSLTKVDATLEDAVEGTTFTLARDNSDGVTFADLTLTTGMDGKVSTDGLIKGTYTLTETAPNANYQNGGFKATFTVTDECQNQTLVIGQSVVGAEPFKLQINEGATLLDGDTIQNARVLGILNIDKLTSDNKALPGVTFEVRDSNNKPMGQPGTTDEFGKLTFSNLPWGEYTLVETAVPAGYVLDATPHSFTIEKGKLTHNFTVAEHSAIVNNQNTFGIEKYQEDGTTGLTGSTFTITGVFAGDAEATTRNLLSGAQSETLTGVLVGGQTYQIQETVPAQGYTVRLAFTVQMSADGKLSPAGEDGLPQGVEIRDGNVIAVSDVQNTASFTKVDAQSEQALSGAQFKLEGTFADGSTAALTWSSSDAQPQQFVGALVANNEYKLTETTPAKGYKVNAWTDSYADAALDGAALVVRVTNEGTLQYKTTGGDDAWAALPDNTVVMKDAQNTASIKKVDQFGDAVSGAQLQLQGVLANGEMSLTWNTSDENAKDVTGQLVADAEYTLVETEVPAGYLPMEPVVIKMDASGVLYQRTGDAASSTWTEVEGNALVVQDERVLAQVSLAKKDATSGEPLEGATFDLFKVAGEGATNVCIAQGVTVTGNTATWTSANAPQNATNADTGKPLSEGLAVGDYYFVETAAPMGYELDATPVEFTVENKHYNEAIALVVDNPRKTGSVALVKVDGDNASAPINNVEFTLEMRQGEGDSATWTKVGTCKTGLRYASATDTAPVAADAGTLRIDGLEWGDYRLQETSAAGYKLVEDYHEFTIGAQNAGEEPAEALGTHLGTIENSQTSFWFTKMELYNETCSDPSLGSGAGEPDATRELTGAQFTAYTDADCTTVAKTAAGEDAVAESDLAGRVTFNNLPSGTYYVRETGVPSSHVESTDVYQAVVAADGSATFTQVGSTQPVTQVVNDVQRTNIRVQKVSELDLTKPLANSTYGLYKRLSTSAPTPRSASTAIGVLAVGQQADVSSDPTLQLIAKATTGADGVLEFSGVLMDQEYVIQELVAPDGSLVSKNPITMTFKVDADGAVVLSSFDDGSGTAEVNPDGTVTWKEPQVEMDFAKTDPSGNLLAGAMLQVVDATGAVVVQPWTSSADAPQRVTGVLVAGETYRLQELSAPAGYLKADDVEFTVENPQVAPGEAHVQTVSMVDAVDPASADPGTPGTTGTTGSSGGSAKATTTKTGDGLLGWMYALGAVAVSAAGVTGVAALRKRRRRR